MNSKKTLDRVADFERIAFATPVPALIWSRVDGDFFCVGANQAAVARLAKLTLKAKGRHARKLFDDRPEIVDEMNQAMDSGVACETVLLCHMNADEPHLLACTLAPYPPEHLITYLLDVSAARSSPDMATYYRAAMDVASDALAVVESHAQRHWVLACNEAFLQLTRSDRAMSNRTPLTEFLSSDVLRATLRSVAEDGIPADIDQCLLLAPPSAPSEISVSARIVALPMSSKNPRGLVLALRELPTNDNPADRRRPKPGSLLVNAFPGIMFRCRNDDERTMEAIEGRCLPLTGYYPRQLIHNTDVLFASLVHPQDQARVRFAISRALDLHHPYEIEYRLRHRNGRYRHVREQGIGIYGSHDEIEGIEGLIHDVTRLHTLARRLQRNARTDVISGALTLDALERRLNDLLQDADVPQQTHSLLYLDIDAFSVLNEECGSEGGNQYLRQIVRVLRASVRRCDDIARVGADRFAILLERCPAAKARSIASHIRSLIEESRFTWDGKDYALTASVGLVVFYRKRANASDLLRYADQSCNTAKELGRNCTFEFDETDARFLARRSRVQGTTAIGRALSQDQFVIYCQEIRGIKERDSGLHFEILVRMLDLDGALMLPNTFLPSAEQYGLAPKIDRWVVGHTLEFLMANRTFLDRTHMCALNLSGRSLGDSSVLDYLVNVLEDLKFPAEKLCFEITESAAVSEFQDALRFMQVLRNLGCRFALDDFGAGASSFGYLKRLPVDIIKIDGQFVRGIATSNIDLEIVRSAAAIAKTSGKCTIAEFVESEEILWHLEKIGVDYAQGYYIGRPLPLTAFTEKTLSDNSLQPGNG